MRNIEEVTIIPITKHFEERVVDMTSEAWGVGQSSMSHSPEGYAAAEPSGGAESGRYGSTHEQQGGDLFRGEGVSSIQTRSKIAQMEEAFQKIQDLLRNTNNSPTAEQITESLSR